MNVRGRPLRFLGYVVGGWVGLRAAMLLGPALWAMAMPDPPVPSEGYQSVRDGGGAPGNNPLPLPSMAPRLAPSSPILPARYPADGHISIGQGSVAEQSGGALHAVPPFVRPPPDEPFPAGSPARHAAAETDAGRAGGFPVSPIAPRSDRRWSGTAWLIWRPDVGSTVQAPLLGGSQGGARLDFRLTKGRLGQLGLYGRISRAFTGPASEEAALGVAWRVGGLPLSLLAERRVRLGTGGRNGFAFLAAGGFGPRELAPRIEAEGYAQAGIVEADGFADGKASLGYRLLPKARVTLGATLSGSVQPGAERLDIGPELRWRLPAGLRLSAEWRTRIAGHARPASGPAVTLVADF